MGLLLGCIADDFTGGTDLANNLVRAGMRTVQVIGVPDAASPAPDADAVVVALKSRTAPVGDAVAQSLSAARWLRAQGATQIYFKVCSTFDSTPRGNIGPVTEALMDELQAPFVIITPAFPENARTVFKGHLFVGDLLLSDSSMKNHPLTPMTDASLVRVMQAQLDPARGRRVGLIDYRVVARGAAAIAERVETLRAEGASMAIVDALNDDDLRQLARACATLPLVVAGSGLAIGIPAVHGLQPDARAAQLPPAGGARAVVSGSCSAATNAQVAAFIAAGGAGLALDPLQLAAGRDLVAEALAWARPRLGSAPVLVYATAEPAAVRAVQQQLGARSRRRAGGAGVVAHCRRPGARGGGPIDRGRRRDLGRLRAGPEHHAAAHRAADRPGRALVPCSHAGAAQRAAPGAEVRQLRRQRLLQPRLRTAVSDEARLREEICRVGLSLYERGYVHASAGNISVRLDDGWLITPTDACLGRLDPARLARLDSALTQTGGDRASKTLALHRRIYQAAPDARCVIHTHSTHLVALTLQGVWSNDDIVPPITPYFVMKVGHVPLIPYHRPGDAMVAELVAQRIEAMAARGTPIRAVMLERLGPNVWHRSLGEASAVLEELEETAKLWLLCQPRPAALSEAQIDELRREFGAAW